MTREQPKHQVTHQQKHHLSNELLSIFCYMLLILQQKTVGCKSSSNIF